MITIQKKIGPNHGTPEVVGGMSQETGTKVFTG